MAGPNYFDQFVPEYVGEPVAPVPAPVAGNGMAASIAAINADPMASLTMNTAMERGNTLATDNEIISDYQSLPFYSFEAKYGPDIAAQMSQLSAGGQELVRAKDTSRDFSRHYLDFGMGAATGLVGGLGDAATLVAGSVNRDAGLWASESTQAFRDWMNENTQSNANQRNKVLSAIRAELDGQDNAKQYEQDRENQSGFMAGLSYLGRGFVNGAYRFYEDPQSLETGLAEGVGSLFAGGPLARGVGLVGKLAGVGKLATTAAMPAAIGLMEGGSAYSGAVQQVMEMSHEELLAASPTFRELVANGMDPDTAREQVAARAGEIAGAIQAPIGALTGKLVSHFEANPLGSKGFREMVGNIIRETTEEGIQSASGQTAQNVAIQGTADENQSLLEGVGEQTAQGAILGSLTAGVVQVPAIPRAALNDAARALRGRAERLRAANEAGSGVTEADLRAAGTEATANKVAVVEAVNQMVAAAPEEVRNEVGANTLVQRIEEALTITEKDVRSLGKETAKYFQEKGIEFPKDRINLLISTARAVTDPALPAEAKTKAGLFLLDQIEKSDKLFGEDIEEAKSSLNQEEVAYQAVSNFQNVIAQLKAAPTFMTALEDIRNNTEVNISGNETVSASTLEDAIQAMTAKPSAVSSKGIRTILRQDSEGTITLTDAQRTAFRNAAEVSEIAEIAQEDIIKYDNLQNYETTDTKDVNDQIMRRGRKEDWGLSVDQHVGRINAALLAGDQTGAETALRHFGNFAASQRNKAEAAIRSVRDGGRQTFARLGASGGRNPVDGNITIHPNSSGSMALGRRVIIEANALIEQVNALLNLNPQLNINTRLNAVEMASEFFGSNNVENQSQNEDNVQENQNVTEELPQEDIPSVVEQVAEKTEIEKKFPFLVKTTKNGNKTVEPFNRFTQAFNANKMGKFLNYGQPLNEFGAFLTQENFSQKYGFDAENIDALVNFLRRGWKLIYTDKDGLAHRFRTFLGTNYNSDYPTFLDGLNADQDIAGLARGHATAILEKIDGKYQYNPALIQTAMLAALNWYSGSQNRTTNMDKETLAKSLGISPDELTNAKVQEFNGGVGLTQAVRGLAEEISRFWGLQSNKDAPENLVKGIPEAIAKEILEAMELNGFMASGSVTVPGKKLPFKQYYFGDKISPDLRNMLLEMGPARNLIEENAVSQEERSVPTFDQPPKGIASTQMRNKAVRNTKTQRKVLKKAQSIPYKFYRNSYDMYRAIGIDALIDLMGSYNTKDRNSFNEEHLKSIDGKNLTISMAYDAMEQQLLEVEAHARATGQNADDINKYYQFNYSRVNRLQMLGVNNPQGDKINRHIWLPTRTTINMTDEGSPEAMGFWMAIAQGLGDAEGWKPNQHTPQENAAYGRFLIEDKFFPLVQELSDWLKKGKKTSLSKWANNLRQIAPKITEHGMMSLLSGAEYNNARDAGTLESFTTHNYFEADGVTNGPANVLMNMSTVVTPEWLNTIAKTGSFIGNSNTSMVSQNKTPDLYNSASNLLSVIQQDFADTLEGDARKMHDALFNVMQGLGMKITIQDGEIKIERKVLKNPLTITIYGSGVDGIAGNVAGELIDNLYEAITDYIQSGKKTAFGEDMVVQGQPYSAEGFWTDLEYLLNNMLIKSDDKLVVNPVVGASTGPIRIPNTAQLKKIAISPNDFRTLRGNVRHLLVDNMAAAISSTVMGHVSSTVNTIQKAVNAQSIVMSYLFRKEVLKAMAKLQKTDTYRPGDFLSQNELDAIMQRLMPYGAVVNTDHQSFFIGLGEHSDLMPSVKTDDLKIGMPQSFSRSLFDKLQTAAYAYSPSFAGVSGVPSINIGTGDGRMIDIFLENSKNINVLPVFDGINFPVDRLVEGSQIANAAVMQSWTENPVKHIADSFRAWMALDPVKQLFDSNDPFNVEMGDFAVDMTRNIEGFYKIKEPHSAEEILMHMEDFLNTLTVNQQMIADRIDVMQRMPMSVDQMAGAMEPYTQEGSIEIPQNASKETLATIFNHEMKKVVANRTKEEAVSRPSREFVQALRSKAGTDPDTGALIADVSALDSIRKTLNNKLPNHLREMLNASLNSLADSGITVVFGTPETVSRYEQNNYPDTYQNEGIYYGKIDVNNNVIYLTNPSAETLAHELLHAATIHKMQGFYRDSSFVSQTDGEAITRIEGLMNEWLSRTYDREKPSVADAHRLAISTVVGFLNQGRKAEAVNEFLAWSLTNQNIISLQKKMQVQNPIYRVMGEALSALKRLIWGHKKALQIGTDMFANVRFNARVLMATPTPVELFMRDFGEVSMYQSSSFGSDPRLSDIRKKFGEHLVTYVKTATSNNQLKNKADYAVRRQNALEALYRNSQTANAFAVPFRLNMQQISTFKMIGATLATAQHLNKASLARMNDVYSAVIDKLKVEDFLYNVGDAETDRYQAQQKYNMLIDGGENQLGNFIALATVEPQLRDILRKMEFPAKIMDKSWRADALFERAQAAISSGLANYASGQGKENIDLLAAMEALSGSLVDNIGDQRSFIEQRIDNGLDNADNIIKTYIEKGAKKVENWGKTLSNPIGKKASKYLTFLSRSFTEEGSNSLTRAGVSFFNQPEQMASAREAYNEVVGRTEENAPVFDMITKARTFVDQTRQRWREEFPRELRRRFSKKLSESEWADLHIGLAKTDAGVLFHNYGRTEGLEFLSSGSKRAAEIKNLEAKFNASVIQKMKQLANYMLTGDHGPQLQRNAYAINVLNKLDGMEKDIDNLVTLYALENMSKSTKDTIENLMDTDPNGFSQIYHSVVSTRNDEVAKNNTGISKMNSFKGHLRGVRQDGVHLVIDSRVNHSKYMSMGYVDLGLYNGSSADVAKEKKGYYFAPVSGRAKFNQGIMQTVEQSVFGVNPETGFSVGTVTAGRVTDPRAVQAITSRIRNQRSTTENLLPIYNNSGVIIAYERAVDPAKLSYLNEELDLATSLGAWRGRQSEEQASKIINEQLVDKVFDMWNAGKLEHRVNEFENMAKSNDPIIKDAWSVIPRETKDYIKSKFGNDGFPVRRSELLDIAGARSATIGDFWTGNSRWAPAVQDGIKDMITGLAGNDAYRYLVKAEALLQQVITDAKVIIVVKSVIVPAANIVSNVYQLSMNGVPMRHIFSGFKKKTFELNTYIRNREQERQLQNDLFVVEGANDSMAIRKLNARLQVIRNGYKNLSIWPLLEAGEFGAITEGGISQEDLAISKGGYAALIDSIANKIPDNVLKDVVRYGFVTRDTSLFKALSRATQYGDFLAKAVLYDDLTLRKKMNTQEALGFINEEFVNYNRFAGRNRAYLESIGMTWFYNFKLRSMKIAQRALHKHPVRALLHTALMPRLPLLGSVGNPITDNMLSVIMDGRLGYSTGPSMLFRAPELNPWYNLVD